MGRCFCIDVYFLANEIPFTIARVTLVAILRVFAVFSLVRVEAIIMKKEFNAMMQWSA